MLKQNAIFVFVYAVLVLAGGIMGFVKAQSYMSLITGSLFALLFITSAILMFKGVQLGSHLAIAGSFILLLFFGYRYYLTESFMPAALMALLSASVLLLLLYRRLCPLYQ